MRASFNSGADNRYRGHFEAHSRASARGGTQAGGASGGTTGGSSGGFHASGSIDTTRDPGSMGP